MATERWVVLTFVSAGLGISYLNAQELTPRAYVITPTGTNAVILAFAYNTGQVLLDPTIPITDLKAQFQLPILSVYHSFGILGRSANVAASMPYGYGHFEGRVLETQTRVSRSGLADARIRLAVNLRGGRAIGLRDFLKYRESTVIGASLTTVIPTGQHDSARLINPGANRWAFKPEIGISRRWRSWVVDAYGGVWFFTANSQFFPGNSVRKQNAIASLEFHLTYYLRRMLWVSFDSNFWARGNTVLNGVENTDGARNSRLGGTAAIPITRHQSLKFSASRGTIVRIGGNFTTITAGWQYPGSANRCSVHLPDPTGEWIQASR